MQNIIVELGARRYPIYLGNGILHSIGELCSYHQMPRQLALISDRTVSALYLNPVLNTLKRSGFKVIPIIIPQGEKQKSLVRASQVYKDLTHKGFSRNSGIVAFGGGVVGDLAGFVAATFRRGIPYVQIPTTLLGQIESSIGGKTSVNLHTTKNAVGAFYQPRFVFSDTALLSTLPKREIMCGLGELLKYAYLNEEIFGFIDNNLDKIVRVDLSIIEEAVKRCNELKAQMIADDEREQNPNGGRMVLNLGHTIGHAMENLSLYKLHHGEAVLLGLKCELEIARMAGILEEGDYTRLDTLLDRVKYKPKIVLPSAAQVIQSLYKKSHKAKFVLPKKIGEVIQTEEITSSATKSMYNTLIMKLKIQKPIPV